MRFVPLIGIALVFLVGVVWRSWLQRRRHGTWGVVHVGLSDPTQAAMVAILILAFGLLVGQAFEAALHPADIYLGAPPQRVLILSAVGVVLVIGGLALLWRRNCRWAPPGGSESTKTQHPA